MSKKFQKTMRLYVAVYILITASSFIYLTDKSYVLFLEIILVSIIFSYFMPLGFKIFLKAKPYKGKFRIPLMQYAQKHDVKLHDIYLIPSKHSNAFAFGYANKKIVCFTTNTLENHPWDEIEGVMAHEIGHHKNRDIFMYTIITPAILITSIWLVALVHTLLFISWYSLFLISFIMSTILLLIGLKISRWRESIADQFAKKILDKPAKLGRFLERMLVYERKLGEKAPVKLTFLISIFLTHPWIFQRIKYFRN